VRPDADAGDLTGTTTQEYHARRTAEKSGKSLLIFRRYGGRDIFYLRCFDIRDKTEYNVRVPDAEE
jgi:hypothetical protein